MRLFHEVELKSPFFACGFVSPRHETTGVKPPYSFSVGSVVISLLLLFVCFPLC